MNWNCGSILDTVNAFDHINFREQVDRFRFHEDAIFEVVHPKIILLLQYKNQREQQLLEFFPWGFSFVTFHPIFQGLLLRLYLSEVFPLLFQALLDYIDLFNWLQIEQNRGRLAFFNPYFWILFFEESCSDHHVEGVVDSSFHVFLLLSFLD